MSVTRDKSGVPAAPEIAIFVFANAFLIDSHSILPQLSTEINEVGSASILVSIILISPGIFTM